MNKKKIWNVAVLGLVTLVIFAAIGYFGMPQIGRIRAFFENSGVSSSSSQHLAFAVQVDDGGGFRTVSQDYRFRGGDRFRILGRASFPGYIYAFHRDRASGQFDVLLPGSQAMAAGQETVVPPQGVMHMDDNPEPEEFTIIASARPLEELRFSGNSVPVETLEEALRKVLKESSSSDLTDEGEWRKVRGKNILHASLTLRHD